MYLLFYLYINLNKVEEVEAEVEVILFCFFHGPVSFFPSYTRNFVTYSFETTFFFLCAQIGLLSIRNGTYVMYGTYIEPTLLHFCVVACYSVTLSKTVNPLTEKPLFRVV